MLLENFYYIDWLPSGYDSNPDLHFGVSVNTTRLVSKVLHRFGIIIRQPPGNRFQANVVKNYSLCSLWCLGLFSTRMVKYTSTWRILQNKLQLRPHRLSRFLKSGEVAVKNTTRILCFFSSWIKNTHIYSEVTHARDLLRQHFLRCLNFTV